MTNYRKAIKNLIFGVGGQLIVLMMGFLLPRFVLTSFGSEVNGLLATVTQIFTYVALLEAGIGNASITLLYKFISQKDEKGIALVVSATKKYFRKLSGYYFLCVIALTIIFPIAANSNIDKTTIAAVIILQGLSGLINFYFVSAYEQLLIADGRNYVVSNINVTTNILTTLAKIILIFLGANIIIVQLAFLIVSCVKAVVMNKYYKSKYSWLKLDLKNSNTSLLSQRKAFLVHELSTTVFNSTDVIILSFFNSMAVASVYAIYNLVFTALNVFISTINNSFVYLLGQTYHREKDLYTKIHDAYDSFYISFVFSTISCAYVLILPFVTLYTAGVNDVDYIDKNLPILFAIIHLLSSGRAVSARLITIAGHAPNTQFRSMFEAIINLVLSMLLVNIIGIYGVLLGTIIALLYRSNDIIIYANTKILNRLPFRTYLNFGVNIFLFSALVFLNRVFEITISNYIDFIKWGFIIAFVIYPTYFIINGLLNYKLMKVLIYKVLFRKRFISK
jgi:O-antigen/teichoic acid export membrane protein